MALVGDDGGDVAPFADTDQNLLRRQRSLGHAAKPFKANEPARLDLADDEAKLIHVREKHHARPALIAGRGRDQVAEPVGLRRKAERFDI